MRMNPRASNEMQRESEPGGAANRRSEPRFPASGQVRLCNFGDMVGWFSAQLVDCSEGGFRARHGCLHLPSGQLVGFQMLHQSGIARVAWTRVSHGLAETGFRIVTSESC